MKSSHRVILGIGSNIGNSEEYIRQAVCLLDDFIDNIVISQLYKTSPRDYTDQQDFLNCVLAGDTTVPPMDLLGRINTAEASLGRNRTGSIPKGPRTIDIDILLYGDSVINTSRLSVPHPAIRERKFVLLPMAEICPEAKDPVTGELYISILENMENQGIYYSSLKLYSTILAWNRKLK